MSRRRFIPLYPIDLTWRAALLLTFSTLVFILVAALLLNDPAETVVTAVILVGMFVAFLLVGTKR